MKERVYTVTEFNRILKVTLEENNLFKDFFLKGEISNITYYRSGHLYFSLKDKDSQLKCVAFNYKMKRIREDLKEGDSVKIFCDIGVYEARGEIQALVRHIEKEENIGTMFQKLEILKKELMEKGYFDKNRKKKLPKYPKIIGVVTSLNGAALHDIIKTVRKRDDRVTIYIYPAKVQGPGSAEEIKKGIEELNKFPEVDLIVAGRGGGSTEDLWAFNEKIVADAFFRSEKPIISAVGHETDMLLTDYVADVRASTPTQAIEIAIPEKKQLIKELEVLDIRLKNNLSSKVKDCEKELEKIKSNYHIRNFSKSIEKRDLDLVELEKNIRKELERIIESKNTQLKISTEKVIGLNPLRILSRGYSITEFEGKSVNDSSCLKPGDDIIIKFETGAVKSTVKEIIS